MTKGKIGRTNGERFTTKNLLSFVCSFIIALILRNNGLGYEGWDGNPFAIIWYVNMGHISVL